MEEKIVIYAAGNPDAYPLEYYDEVTQSYQGIIPDLFRAFSEQSQYDIVYYQLMARIIGNSLEKTIRWICSPAMLLGLRPPPIRVPSPFFRPR